MIKKLLLMVALVASLFSSAEANIDLSATAEGKVTIILSRYNQGTQDWIGIYKHGASNDWGNVQQWSWLDNTEENGMDHLIRYMDIGDLPEGTYDIRYFLKNSYTVYKSTTVTLKKAGEATISVYAYDDGEEISIHDYTTSGSKCWIGIYKKGASNAWENVIDWTWCKNDGSAIEMHLPGRYGEYEARLFYHNSYHVEAKASFTLNDKHGLVYGSQHDNQLVVAASISHDQDWVGLFNIGASNDWDNVLGWTWVYGDEASFSIANVPSGTYELRLFYHNSYDVEATTRITITH